MLPIAVLWGCVMCSVSILVEVVLFSKNVLDNTCIEGGHRWPHRVVGGHINFAGGHIQQVGGHICPGGGHICPGVAINR